MDTIDDFISYNAASINTKKPAPIAKPPSRFSYKILVTIAVFLMVSLTSSCTNGTPSDEEFKKIWGFKDEDLMIKGPEAEYL